MDLRAHLALAFIRLEVELDRVAGLEPKWMVMGESQAGAGVAAVSPLLSRDHFERASASKVVFMTAMPCSIMTSIWLFMSFGKRSAIHTTRLPSFAPAKT
jgi:hypothetical protein